MEWISIKKELPFDYEVVLILHDRQSWVAIGRYIFPLGFQTTNGEVIKNVSHWCLLPEKPKSRKKGEDNDKF